MKQGRILYKQRSNRREMSLLLEISFKQQFHTIKLDKKPVKFLE